MTRLALFLLVSFFAWDVNAQLSTQDSLRQGWLLTIGAGGNITNWADRGMSPLNYSATMPAITSDLYYGRKKAVHQLQFMGVQGQSSSSINTRTNTLYFHMIQNNLWKLRDQKSGYGIMHYLGFHAMTSYADHQHLQYTNNTHHYDFSLLAGPSYRVDWDFSFFQQNFRLATTALLPLSGVFIRPAFASSSLPAFINNQDEGFSAYLNSMQWARPSNHFRFQSEWSIEWFLPSRNGLQLRYLWDYRGYQPEFRGLQVGMHTLDLALIYRIK
ncbi:MAG: hypothetical protein LAT68_14180 [Cyclobacteriaceae bacterium]|nr:hypothetical protein [Cyclobacteriaceae bacterium]MCH8517469.1 hypothetical protein [Cyclobacteriaceae bacterium]